MSSASSHLAAQYANPALLEKVMAALEASGLSPKKLRPEDLSGVDEFHIGGRPATERFASALGLLPGMEVLDIGCGIGGAARYLATCHHVKVTGIDITPDFIALGRHFNTWLGLAADVRLAEASALDLPFADNSMDAAIMIHDGMNIADKNALMAEVSRVVKPGGVFGIYDVMLGGNGPVSYPMPWANQAEDSEIAPLQVYEQALKDAGFTPFHLAGRREECLKTFAEIAERRKTEGTPPLNLSLVLKEHSAEKISNIINQLKSEVIIPTEIISRKS